MLMEPLVVVVELIPGCKLLMALDLQLMQLSQVTLGADMGEEMGGVSEGGLFWADAAVEHRGHDASAGDQIKSTKMSRQAQSNDCCRGTSNDSKHCPMEVQVQQ